MTRILQTAEPESAMRGISLSYYGLLIRRGSTLAELLPSSPTKCTNDLHFPYSTRIRAGRGILLTLPLTHPITYVVNFPYFQGAGGGYGRSGGTLDGVFKATNSGHRDMCGNLKCLKWVSTASGFSQRLSCSCAPCRASAVYPG